MAPVLSSPTALPALRRGALQPRHGPAHCPSFCSPPPTSLAHPCRAAAGKVAWLAPGWHLPRLTPRACSPRPCGGTRAYLAFARAHGRAATAAFARCSAVSTTPARPQASSQQPASAGSHGCACKIVAALVFHSHGSRSHARGFSFCLTGRDKACGAAVTEAIYPHVKLAPPATPIACRPCRQLHARGGMRVRSSAPISARVLDSMPSIPSARSRGDSGPQGWPPLPWWHALRLARARRRAL